MKSRWLLFVPVVALVGCAFSSSVANPTVEGPKGWKPKVVHTAAEWKKLLTKAQYNILREKGTENAYSGKYWDFHGKGIFVCAGCGQDLFSSDTKFDSGTGWPSFYQAIKKGAVVENDDHSLGMDRTEVLCSNCGGHLGHVFDDGPKPTGLRYCMNSDALVFKKASAKK